MNILFILSNKPYFEDIVNAADAAGHSICILPALPEQTEEAKALYLQDVVACVKEINADCIFTLDFDPFISLAAMVIGIKYKAWLVSPYDVNIYDSTIANECNELYVADSTLIGVLTGLGVKNAVHLPLAIPVIDDSKVTALSEQADITLFGEVFDRTILADNPQLPESPLLDSTKGYLEGCIACKYQLADTNFESDKLPDYIWKDITSNYSKPDSLEGLKHYMDANYFNPMVTWADRSLHFLAVLAQERYRKIRIFSANDDSLTERFKEKEITFSDRVDYHNDLPSYLRSSTISLLIPSRNRVGGISPVLWNAFSQKAFCITPMRKDLELIQDAGEITYRTEQEMQSKSAYYSAHEDERTQIAQKIFEDVTANHTYDARIKVLFK